MTNSSGLSMLPSQFMAMVSGKLVVERWYLKLMWNTDWVKVPVVETVQRVVCATTNRVFVGAPLCALRPPVLPSNQCLMLIGIL